MIQSFTRKMKAAALMTVLSTAAFQSEAATFTAVASGNFNSSATWGGVAPGSILTSDVIIIPLGLNVTLTDGVTFSGTSSLTVLGTLNSTSGGNLIMTSGDLSGAGNIDVDSFALGLTSGISFIGNVTARKMTSTGANVSSAANIYVRQMLRLSSGTLNMASGKLSMAEKSTIEVMGGTLATSGSAILNLDSTYNVLYGMGATATGIELYGKGLDSVTVNVGSSLNLSDDAELNGVLTLQSGILALNNNTLTLGADANLSTMGSGTISGSSFSNLVINSNTSLSGSLKFTSGSNLLNNLDINMSASSSSVGLGSDLNINGQLHLQSGRIRLGSSNLAVNAGGSVMGGSSNSFVITDGTGRLTLNLATGTTDTFYVGTLSDYTPIVVEANPGSATSDVSVNVNGSVMANGTSGTVLSATQPMVRSTWFVSSTASTGIDFTLTAMWNTALEVNGFNRSQAYLSHYTGGSWDATSASAATSLSGGMYSMTRTGITSLSPFMVTDKDAMTTSIKNVGQEEAGIVIYPSPAANVINFSAATAIEQVDIFNMDGKLVKSVTDNNNISSVSVQELPAGTYFVRFNGRNVSATEKFVKQ